MSPAQWMFEPFRKYATFSGRASRSEFWWFFLFANFLALLAAGFDFKLALAPVVGIYGPISLVTVSLLLLPLLAVQVRRIQDTNRPGLYVLLFYVPYIGLNLNAAMAWNDPMMRGGLDFGTGLLIGGICMMLGFLMLAWSVQAGTRGPNDYGPDPLNRTFVA